VNIALLAGAGATLAYYQVDMTPMLLVTEGVVLALGVFFLLRRAGVRLFGPILAYDLARHARRPRTYLSRLAYVAVLFFCLWVNVAIHSNRLYYPPETAPPTGERMAALTEGFFYTFLAVQFALTLILTPAYVAPAIADEKERKTLEFLLTTDLDSREIVLGKLLARLGQVALLLLAGLPVLGAVQFLGGVEPELVFAGFAATALTALSLAGVAMLASVCSSRTREAVGLAYALPVVYLMFCIAGDALVEFGLATPIPLFGVLSAADCVHAFQCGSPPHAFARLFSGSPGSVVILPALPAYAAFHLLVAAAAVTLAVLGLRPLALLPAGGAGTVRAGRAKTAAAPPRAPRPVVGRPMVWKECHFGDSTEPRLRKRPRYLLLTLGTLASAFYVYADYEFGRRLGPADTLSLRFNLHVRTIGTLLAFGGSVATAVQGALAVRTEKDKATLDSLLTSPLSADEILFGKWVGCLWGLRWPTLWLAIVYLVGLVAGGLSALAVPLLAVAAFAYWATLAVVGLWFSVVCRTTLRAIVAAVAGVAVLWGGYWALLALCCGPFELPRESEFMPKFVMGITPPIVLAVIFPFSGEETGWLAATRVEMIVFALIGTACWASLGGLLWAAVNQRFKALHNRGDVLVPEASSERRAAG
jgi:ABC-type transport system involved in multi-copper enzyme maturation permease subunit